jgi:hypothetical protein
MIPIVVRMDEKALDAPDVCNSSIKNCISIDELVLARLAKEANCRQYEEIRDYPYASSEYRDRTIRCHPGGY